MKEMEIFLELIDEKEANRILKYFNETPTGTRKTKATFEQKKQHIKKIFKSATPNMIRKRRKGAADPFYSYINNYSLPEEPPLKNFKEYLNFVNESKRDVSSYRRYSLLLLKFPEETRERSEGIKENIKEGKDPLDLDVNFIDKEELKTFLINIRSYIGENAPINIINSIEKFQPEEYQEKLKECMKVMTKYDLLQYHYSKNEIKAKYGVNVSNAAYILSHKNEDQEINMHLAIEAMYYLLKLQREISLEENTEKLKEVTETLISVEKAREIQIQEKDREVESIKLELTKLNKNVREINNDNEKLKNDISYYQGLEAKHETRLKEMNIDYEMIINNIQKDYKHKIRDLERKIKLIEIVNNYKGNKFNSDTTFTKDWGIICNTDYDLFQELYPELTIVHAENRKEWESVILDRKINRIYLFMKGLSTKQFKSIKKFVEKNNKDYKALELDSFKEFMDWIGYVKISERNVITK
jgi:hypothetical protein